ncbi:MAG TPA: hypothetical protein VGO26_02355 [Amnibacterium sp.]|nr:hypothetical protein [Amnibacterium sp.]
MATESRGQRSQGWGWVAVIVLAVAVNLLVQAFRAGECVHFASGASSSSACTSGPAVGVPAAWFIAGVGLIAIGFSAFRLVRPRA